MKWKIDKFYGKLYAAHINPKKKMLHDMFDNEE